MSVQAIKKEIKDNKPTWIWRSAMLGLMGILGFLGSWMFAEVAAMPKEYATKKNVRELDIDNNQEHREITKKIDDGFKETQRMILELHNK